MDKVKIRQKASMQVPFESEITIMATIGKLMFVFLIGLGQCQVSNTGSRFWDKSFFYFLNFVFLSVTDYFGIKMWREVY